MVNKLKLNSRIHVSVSLRFKTFEVPEGSELQRHEIKLGNVQK